MIQRICKLLKRFLFFLGSPFGKNFNFFLVILFVSSVVDFVSSCFLDNILVATYIEMHHFVICYFLTLIYGLFPHKIRTVYKGVIFFLLFISSVIDLGCIAVFQRRFCLDYADIIMGTNLNEALEFGGTYLSSTFFIFLALLICIFVLCVRLLSKFKLRLKWYLQSLLVFFVLISFSYIFWGGRQSHWNIISLGKFYTFLSIPNIDLKDYQVYPSLISESNHKPKNVVLIIGESFSKSNSSLYGYEKNTNPCLDSLVKTGNLSVYKDVRASGLYTIEAFKNMMSTYYPNSDKEWYECLTILEVMKNIQYHTEWISNQSKKGFYDNVITSYASLCDTMIFSGNQYAGLDKSDKDGILIDITKKRIEENINKNRCFYVIHMMGSHNEFKIRYTEDYDKFKSKDYPNRLPQQRELLAQYDNSILYNDYVVTQLMNLFGNEESVIYYFSDHGLDIYNARDDYFGHAIKGNSQSCNAAEQIPFLIYCSDLFQDKFPDITQRIRNSVDHKYKTEDIIYSLMDILEVRFIDNNDVQQKSLFRHDE